MTQSVRTMNYRLIAEHVLNLGPHDSKTLPQGAYISPIKLEYVPKHITDSDRNGWHKEEYDVYCFTRYGIISIPRCKIRQEF